MATAPAHAAPRNTGAFRRIGRTWRWVGGHSPFALLAVTPLVTVPVTALLVFTLAQDLNAGTLGLPVLRDQGTAARLYYFDFWPTWALITTPGLLNMLVVLWFFQRNTYVRVEAGIALVVAIVRTFGVLLAFFAISQSDLITHEGGILMRLEVDYRVLSLAVHSPGSALLRLLATVWLSGVVVWGLTVLAWGLYNLVMDRFLPHLNPPKRRQAVEPRRWGGFLDRR